MLLSVKKRQEYLKLLGFYDGKIDGIVGPNTKKAYKNLQNAYFVRNRDKDGLYGKNTDILLRNVYNIHLYCKNFNPQEFACHCRGKYCTGYPAELNVNLLKNIQFIRNKYGSTNITSPLRCQRWNDLQKGSTKNSKHTKGMALDFTNAKCKTLDGRKEVINYWFSLNKPSYAYCNGFYRSGNTTGKRTASNMGTSVHADIK